MNAATPDTGGPDTIPEPQRPALCRRTPDDDCSAYHGFWPTLRALDLAATPARHAAFYHDVCGRLAHDGAQRVLLAGMADAGMLAQVLQAWTTAPPPIVTAIDRCATPLAATRTWAAARNVPLTTAIVDLRHTAPAPGFDLVASHSLLTAISPDDRPAVLGHLFATLRAGGAFVSVARVDPTHPATDDARVAAFVDRVASAARARGIAITSSLRDAAARYARWTVVQPLASIDALEQLLAQAGFRVARCDRRDLGGIGSGAAAGTAQSGTYAEFVAVRP